MRSFAATRRISSARSSAADQRTSCSTGRTPSAGAAPAAASSGSTFVAFFVCVAAPAVLSELCLQPIEQIGFGYAITGFAGGFNGDQNRAASIPKGLAQTPAMASADGAGTLAKAMAAANAAKL